MCKKSVHHGLQIGINGILNSVITGHRAMDYIVCVLSRCRNGQTKLYQIRFHSSTDMQMVKNVLFCKLSDKATAESASQVALHMVQCS